MPKTKAKERTQADRRQLIDHEKMRQRLKSADTDKKRGGTTTEQGDRRPGPKTDGRRAGPAPRRGTRGAAPRARRRA